MYAQEAFALKPGDYSCYTDTISKGRVTFTDEFKRTAVERLRAGGQSGTNIAIEVGIRLDQRGV